MTSPRLVDCLEYLAANDPNFRDGPTRELAWALTANGIGRQDKLLSVFLAYRAVLPLTAALMEHASQTAIGRIARRAERCLRAAWQLASANQRLADIHLIESTGHRILPDKSIFWTQRLSEKKIKAILANELNSEGTLYQVTGKTPSTRRVRPTPKSQSQSELFADTD